MEVALFVVAVAEILVQPGRAIGLEAGGFDYLADEVVSVIDPGIVRAKGIGAIAAKVIVVAVIIEDIGQGVLEPSGFELAHVVEVVRDREASWQAQVADAVAGAGVTV